MSSASKLDKFLIRQREKRSHSRQKQLLQQGEEEQKEEEPALFPHSPATTAPKSPPCTPAPQQQALVESSSSSSRKKSRKRKLEDTSTWACAVCTLENPSRLRRCQACGERRSTDSNKKSETAEIQELPTSHRKRRKSKTKKGESADKTDHDVSLDGLELLKAAASSSEMKSDGPQEERGELLVSKPKAKQATTEKSLIAEETMDEEPSVVSASLVQKTTAKGATTARPREALPTLEPPETPKTTNATINLTMEPTTALQGNDSVSVEAFGDEQRWQTVLSDLDEFQQYLQDMNAQLSQRQDASSRYHAALQKLETHIVAQESDLKQQRSWFEQRERQLEELKQWTREEAHRFKQHQVDTSQLVERQRQGEVLLQKLRNDFDDLKQSRAGAAVSDAHADSDRDRREDARTQKLAPAPAANGQQCRLSRPVATKETPAKSVQDHASEEQFSPSECSTQTIDPDHFVRGLLNPANGAESKQETKASPAKAPETPEQHFAESEDHFGHSERSTQTVDPDELFRSRRDTASAFTSFRKTANGTASRPEARIGNGNIWGSGYKSDKAMPPPSSVSLDSGPTKAHVGKEVGRVSLEQNPAKSDDVNDTNSNTSPQLLHAANGNMDEEDEPYQLCRPVTVQKESKSSSTDRAKKDAPFGNSTNRNSHGHGFVSNRHAREFMMGMEEDWETKNQHRPPKSRSPRASAPRALSAPPAPDTSASSNGVWHTCRRNKQGGDLWDDDESQEPDYAYKETVRGKAKRQALPCHDCYQCRQYIEWARNNTSQNTQEIMQYSRHRARHAPTSTPVDFWELDFIDERDAAREAQEKEHDDDT